MDEAFDRPSEGVEAPAREWHKLQLAALGFVGLCGVVKGDSGKGTPVWLQSSAGVLALVGLVAACAAVLLVATVAWPVAGRALDPDAGARRLRLGVGLTFLSVAVTALSATSSWWPSDDTPDVAVTTRSGSACGSIVAGEPGWLELDVDGRRVRARLSQLTSLAPVSGCDGSVRGR